MNEDAYLIAQIVAAVGILILVLPSLFRRGINMPTFLRYGALWAVIIAVIVIGYDVWKG